MRGLIGVMNENTKKTAWPTQMPRYTIMFLGFTPFLDGYQCFFPISIDWSTFLLSVSVISTTVVKGFLKSHSSIYVWRVWTSWDFIKMTLCSQFNRLGELSGTQLSNLWDKVTTCFIPHLLLTSLELSWNCGDMGSFFKFMARIKEIGD